jgi:hypothetical protein
MATTTPNFGWPVPTSTDLVKNGATAIEALGDAIDASMVDLEGGTTGQILAKNSNADMDFVWIANDQGDITGVTAGTGISGGGTSGTVTVTNSMATAIDAKGDLVAGTGADAFARLAVGANDTLLVAASGETTGLKWAGGYTTWTPTFTSFTLGNGTATARYVQIGKLIHCQLKVVLGSTSSVSGLIQFTLPVSASTSVQGNYVGLNSASCLDAGTAQYPGTCALISSTDAVIFAIPAGFTYLQTTSTSATVPFTWGSTDQFLVNFVYEAA